MAARSPRRWPATTKTNSGEPAPLVRRRVVVHGRVQGVFFRDTIRRRAGMHRVAGWVRNHADGSVEAVFEGAPDAVDRLVRFCHRGPRGAEVERAHVFEEQPQGLSGFTVSN